MRTWTDLKGRKMEASFVMYLGEKILIKRADGQEFRVSPALFSAADQEYLADLKRESEFFKGATIVVSVKGNVLVSTLHTGASSKYSDGKYSSEAKAMEGDILSVGSQINVGAESEAILLFSNGTTTTLGANSQMTVRVFLQKGFAKSDKKVSALKEEVSSSTLLIDLQVGDLVVDVLKLKKKSNFEITSPLGVAGIRGTSFMLSASAESTKLSVLNGRVDFVSNDKKENQVSAEKVLLSSKEKEPVFNDLADAQKQSIAQTVARAKKEAEEISLYTLRDKLGKSFKTQFVPSAGNLEMIWVEPGKFMMGSPTNETGRETRGSDETQHPVTLTKGFYLGRQEVTNAQWDKVMTTNRSFNKGPNRPVEQVSWTGAVAFCNKLTEMEKKAHRVPRGMAYQLPTEAQWEYACRAGTNTVYSWGDTITKTNAKYDGYQTSDVGQYPSNPWGFFDMHGNVWEWCADWYYDYPSGSVIDPMQGEKPRSVSYRVCRGGSYFTTGTYLRSAQRYAYEPSFRDPTLGFRVALIQAD